MHLLAKFVSHATHTPVSVHVNSYFMWDPSSSVRSKPNRNATAELQSARSSHGSFKSLCEPATQHPGLSTVRMNDEHLPTMLARPSMAWHDPTHAAPAGTLHRSGASVGGGAVRAADRTCMRTREKENESGAAALCGRAAASAARHTPSTLTAAHRQGRPQEQQQQQQLVARLSRPTSAGAVMARGGAGGAGDNVAAVDTRATVDARSTMLLPSPTRARPASATAAPHRAERGAGSSPSRGKRVDAQEKVDAPPQSIYDAPPMRSIFPSARL